MGENIWKSNIQKGSIPRVHRKLLSTTVATVAKFKYFSKEDTQITKEHKRSLTLLITGNSILGPPRWLPGQRVGRVGKVGMLEPLCTIIGKAAQYCPRRKYCCTASERVNAELGCTYSHENWTFSLKAPFVFLVIVALFVTADIKNICLLVSCRIARYKLHVHTVQKYSTFKGRKLHNLVQHRWTRRALC